MSKVSRFLKTTLSLVVIFGVVAILVAPVNTMLVTQAAESPDTIYQKAKEAFASGDKTAAIGLFEQAAKQGHIEAQYQLGIMYMKGWGVARNVKQSYTWLSKAEQAGHHQASRAKNALVSSLDAETRVLLTQ